MLNGQLLEGRNYDFTNLPRYAVIYDDGVVFCISVILNPPEAEFDGVILVVTVPLQVLHALATFYYVVNCLFTGF